MNEIYREERKHYGKDIVINLIEEDGLYTATTRAKSGEQIRAYSDSDYDEARRAYCGMLYDYFECDGPLKGKYAKLRDDLKTALKAGQEAERQNPDDGGTCNKDGAGVDLPRWIEKKVKQAAREAGCGCYKDTYFGYVFTPKTGGRGNARAENAEAMAKKLSDLGYDALCYSQMD